MQRIRKVGGGGMREHCGAAKAKPINQPALYRCGTLSLFPLHLATSFTESPFPFWPGYAKSVQNTMCLGCVSQKGTILPSNYGSYTKLSKQSMHRVTSLERHPGSVVGGGVLG